MGGVESRDRIASRRRLSRLRRSCSGKLLAPGGHYRPQRQQQAGGVQRGVDHQRRHDAVRAVVERSQHEGEKEQRQRVGGDVRRQPVASGRSEGRRAARQSPRNGQAQADVAEQLLRRPAQVGGRGPHAPSHQPDGEDHRQQAGDQRCRRAGIRALRTSSSGRPRGSAWRRTSSDVSTIGTDARGKPPAQRRHMPPPTVLQRFQPALQHHAEQKFLDQRRHDDRGDKAQQQRPTRFLRPRPWPRDASALACSGLYTADGRIAPGAQHHSSQLATVADCAIR